MSVTAPRITWHRTEAWSALVFDKAVTIDADEDRIAVAIDANKLFEVGLIGPDKVKALAFERGELQATFTLDVARTEDTLSKLKVQLQGVRDDGKTLAFDIALGDIAIRAWSAHLRMQSHPEVADTAITSAAPLHIPDTASASSSEFTRTVH